MRMCLPLEHYAYDIQDTQQTSVSLTYNTAVLYSDGKGEGVRVRPNEMDQPLYLV